MELRQRIAEMISALGPSVREQVIDAYAKKERNRRATAIVEAYDQLDKLTIELRRTKPDQESRDADGNVTSLSYSKAKWEELDKTKKRIDKIERAINKAFDNDDFSEVFSLGGSKGGSTEKSEAPVDG